MKILTILFLFILFPRVGSSQFEQFNLDFEEWVIDTLFPFPVWEALQKYPDLRNYNPALGTPVHWTTFGDVLRTEDAFSGQYAAIIPIYYGALSSYLAFGSNCDARNLLCKHGTKDKLMKIGGYYKYLTEMEELAILRFHAFSINEESGSLDTISSAFFEFYPVDEYTPFELKIEYDNAEGTAVDSILISLESHHSAELNNSCDQSWYCNFLFVDNLSFDIVSSIDGPGDTQWFNDIQIYPNPGHGIFHINTKEAPRGTYHLELRDTLGRLMFNEMSMELPLTLDVRDIASGVYFLVLSNEHGDRVVRKVMIGL